MKALDYTAADLIRWADEPREYPPATPTERDALDAALESVLRNAGMVAHGMKERQMVIRSEELYALLKYSRQPEGAEVIAGHALNGITRYFLFLMKGKGFRVTQYYLGERDILFSPRGTQRLMLHW